MIWRYEPREQHDPVFDENVWVVVEVYRNADGSVLGETQEPMCPHGTTLEELEQDLEWMLADLRRWKATHHDRT